MKNLLTKLKQISLNTNNIYFITIGTITTLPILAPIFLKLGLTHFAKMIYLVYSFSCHQYSTRSLHIFDYQYAWCSRDTGIWMGIFFGSLLSKIKNLKLKLIFLPLFIVPIALDGGLQTLFTLLNISSGLGFMEPLYLSNNFTRFLTGSFFGFGIGIFITPRILINNKEPNSANTTQKTKTFNILKYYIFLPLIYIVLVQIWDTTSSTIKPTNFLDSEPKFSYNYFERRTNAVCPTNNIDNIFNIDCFFK